MKIKRSYLVNLLLILSLGLSGCAYRFSRSTLPSHLKSIRIEPVINQTYQSLLGDDLHEKLKAVFRKEAPALQQVNQSAHCDLVVILKKYDNKALNFSASGQVSEYRTTITVGVKFTDKIKDEVLYENEALIGQGDYNLTSGESETQHGQPRAIEELGNLLASNLLSQW